uniref:AlNc14C218G9051 protein n=1 Tax=Albugo laibachii Nc14 TaxID=890382 RepID=F0WRQ5_9STRA|nr:AlNc14C218G9051 [Albugo laibachii Nc14]|eukprot:CCA24020.1 AlNc14C218G9051 [Albugo laibachii Nc14]
MYPHKALQLRIQCLDGSCIDVAIPRKCSFYQLRQLLQYQYVGDGGKRQISWRYIWKNFSIRSDTSDQFEVLFANCSNKIVTKFGVQTGMTLHFAPVDKWKSQRSKK